MPNDKRRHTRHDTTRFVWYQTIELHGGAPTSGLSYVVDVAVGGLGLVIQQPLPTGALLLVKVIFDNQQHNLAAVGRVTHCRESNNGSFSIGLEFLAVPPDSQTFLATHFG